MGEGVPGFRQLLPRFLEESRPVRSAVRKDADCRARFFTGRRQIHVSRMRPRDDAAASLHTALVLRLLWTTRTSSFTHHLCRCIGSAIPALNSPEAKSELRIPADVEAVAPIIVGVPSGPATEGPATGSTGPVLEVSRRNLQASRRDILHR